MKLYKFLVFLGFAASLGLIIDSNILRHLSIHLKTPHNPFTDLLSNLFWFALLICGLILIFASKVNKLKYYGVFFIIIWICIVVNSIWVYTYG